MKATIVFSLCLLLTLTGLAQRNIISLNGIWDVEESIEATRVPKKFSHQVEVPGMINQSKPAFDDIDDFYSNFGIGAHFKLTKKKKFIYSK